MINDRSHTRFSRVGLILFMSIAVTLGSSAIGCSSVDSQAQAETNRIARFEAQVDDLRRLLRIPGLSAVILKDQKVLWARGFGFADLEKQTSAAPDTLYHIASLTKTFASTLVMQLVEQGKVDLNEAHVTLLERLQRRLSQNQTPS